MSHIISSNNCLTAWKDACSYILNNGDGFNLLMSITDPLNFSQVELQEITSSGLLSQSMVSDVINTIFPIRLYRRNVNLNNNDFYDLHESIYLRGKRMKRKNKSRWGNYFLRFTKFGTNRRNQLQTIIDCINSRPNAQKACYIMHVSSIDYDNNTRVIGNPCLQYVQFGAYNNSLHLTAVYRNHDFLLKALGNYIGLASLLEFVSNQTNSNVGSITCHSIHYYLNNKTAVRHCINNLSW